MLKVLVSDFFFMVSWANAKKLFTAAFYGMFVPGKPFQPRVMFVSRAKSLP
jgi:hypothetical protein